MRVFVTGATGLVGSALCTELLRLGYEVTALSRKPPAGSRASLDWVIGDPAVPGSWQAEIDGACAIVHLAGASRPRDLSMNSPPTTFTPLQT